MRRSLIALFGMALLTACTNVNSLKNAFQPHGVLIGAALNVNEVKGNVPEATELITSQFNSIVAENCMKQEVTAPEEGKFDFEDADRLVHATMNAARELTTPLLTLAMGGKGSFTRVTGEAFGSDLTFCSTPWQSSAPGQVELREAVQTMAEIHERLMREYGEA